MRYSQRVSQLQKIAADAAYTHRAATYALIKLAAKTPKGFINAPYIEYPAPERLLLGLDPSVGVDPASVPLLPSIDPSVGVDPASVPLLPSIDQPVVEPGLSAGEAQEAVANNPSIMQKLMGKLPSLASLKELSGSKFDSLQGEKVPAFLKNLTKGQAAGGAAALAALLGGGAYLMNRNSKEQQQAEAAAAIMAAKNLSEEQRRRLLRNLGIGAGAALGGYGLYRSMR